jgi:hypothetical protein
MCLFVLLVPVDLDPVVPRDLLQLIDALLELLKVLTLLLLHLLALLQLVLQLIDLVLQESQALGSVRDLCRVLLCEAPWTHGYLSLLPNDPIHLFLSFDLLMMHLLQHLFVLLNLLLGLSEVPLEVKEELRRLHFLQPPLNTLMLLDQVLYRLVRILNLFLPRADLLRARTVRVCIAIGAPATNFLLFKTLLIHLVDENVDVFTHLFELVAQLLVLGLKVLLLLAVVDAHGLYELRCVPHLVQPSTRLLQGLLNEFVRVPLLHHLLMVKKDRVVRFRGHRTCDDALWWGAQSMFFLLNAILNA